MGEEKKIYRVPIKRRAEREVGTKREPNLDATPLEDRGVTEEPVPDLFVEQPRSQDEVNWRDKALRLQAEMDTYRRRQQRRADDAILEEQARLLRDFIAIVDNLEKALAHMRRDDPLYAGVLATYESMLHLLRREGVTPIPALGEPFDPQVHEAVAVVPASPDQKVDLLVVDIQSQGYRKGDVILRPARVIVAQ